MEEGMRTRRYRNWHPRWRLATWPSLTKTNATCARASPLHTLIATKHFRFNDTFCAFVSFVHAPVRIIHLSVYQ
eukprot:8800056-Pyramimonas_sp.AAC.1